MARGPKSQSARSADWDTESRETSMPPDTTTTPRGRLSVDDAAVLLIDHQAGLLSMAQDYSPDEFRNNVLALADTAKHFRLPTILTTSFENGPNGVLMPELKAAFREAPFIPRPGQINAWDDEDFVAAVKKSGRKQLILAGVVTDVCVTFPALCALEEGYQVFVVVDASGTFNKSVRDAALMRMSQAGAIKVNWFAVACELAQDWRNDMEGLAGLLGGHLPAYKNLFTSHSAMTAKIVRRRVSSGDQGTSRTMQRSGRPLPSTSTPTSSCTAGSSRPWPRPILRRPPWPSRVTGS
jgi:nicotinamidase-related amidase